MKISNIQLRIKRYRKGSNINDIQLIKIADKYHLKFPATKVAEKIGQESIVPINNKIRQTITKAVIDSYTDIMKEDH